MAVEKTSSLNIVRSVIATAFQRYANDIAQTTLAIEIDDFHNLKIDLNGKYISINVPIDMHIGRQTSSKPGTTLD